MTKVTTVYHEDSKPLKLNEVKEGNWYQIVHCEDAPELCGIVGIVLSKRMFGFNGNFLVTAKGDYTSMSSIFLRELKEVEVIIK